MSTSAFKVAPPSTRLSTLPITQDRGIWAMWGLIATEFMLFVCLFAAYYYLGNNKDRWALESAPDLWVPFTTLGFLLAGCIALYLGGRGLDRGFPFRARLTLWFAVLMGIFFLCLEGFEYAFTWGVVAPYSDSYGSIFYAISMLDCLHVTAGILILMFVGALPEIGVCQKSPHGAFKTARLYWYFETAMWFIIVMLLYVTPNLQKLNS